MGVLGGSRSRAIGSRRRVSSVAVALCLLGVVDTPARADSGPWPDRGDGRGALAIERIEIGHIRSWERASYVTVVFERPVYPAELRRRDFLVLDLSGNDRARSDVWFYFLGGDTRWYPYSYDPRTRSVGYGGFWITRLSPRSFRIVLPYVETYFSRTTGGYRFRLASFSKTGAGCSAGCWDALPNGGWLIHDWTRPWVNRWDVSLFSHSTSGEPGAPIALRVTDLGFSGLDKWRVSKRAAGAETWTNVHEGRSTRPVSRFVPAEQGEKLRLRLDARDRAGNAIRPVYRTTAIPYDDSNADAGATFFGLWEEQERDDAYLGTLHVSSTQLDTFSFTADARTYCVSYLVMEDGGYAGFEVDGSSTGIDMSYSRTGPHGVECMEFETKETRTATVDVEEGPINIDGYWYHDEPI